MLGMHYGSSLALTREKKGRGRLLCPGFSSSYTTEGKVDFGDNTLLKAFKLGAGKDNVSTCSHNGKTEFLEIMEIMKA